LADEGDGFLKLGGKGRFSSIDSANIHIAEFIFPAIKLLLGSFVRSANGMERFHRHPLAAK
jgi:hypothetical protein